MGANVPLFWQKNKKKTILIEIGMVCTCANHQKLKEFHEVMKQSTEKSRKMSNVSRDPLHRQMHVYVYVALNVCDVMTLAFFFVVQGKFRSLCDLLQKLRLQIFV